MVLLGEQYEQTIAEMLQKQSVGHQAGACTTTVKSGNVVTVG
jgi:hypothetical protein